MTVHCSKPPDSFPCKMLIGYSRSKAILGKARWTSYRNEVGTRYPRRQIASASPASSMSRSRRGSPRRTSRTAHRPWPGRRDAAMPSRARWWSLLALAVATSASWLHGSIREIPPENELSRITVEAMRAQLRGIVVPILVRIPGNVIGVRNYRNYAAQTRVCCLFHLFGDTMT